MQSVSVRIPYRLEQYEVTIGAGTLSRLGDCARRTLAPHARRIALISNEKVFELYGQRAAQSLRGANFIVAHWLMRDGERFKNIKTLERALIDETRRLTSVISNEIVSERCEEISKTICFLHESFPPVRAMTRIRV